MKEFDLEREIEVVENIIKLLKECMTISLKHKRREESKRIVIDLKMCEAELKRLIEIRAAKAEKKEPAKGNAAV